MVVVGQQLLYVLCAAIVAAAGLGLYGFIGALVLASAAGATAALGRASRHIPVRVRFSGVAWIGILRGSLHSAPSGFRRILIYLKADSLMISVISGTAAVGTYNIAYAMVISVLAISSFFMSALIPSLATANGDDLRKIVEKAFHYMIIFAAAIPGTSVCLAAGRSPRGCQCSLPWSRVALRRSRFSDGVLSGRGRVRIRECRSQYAPQDDLLLACGLGSQLGAESLPHSSLRNCGRSLGHGRVRVVTNGVRVVEFRRVSGITVALWRIGSRPLLAAALLLPLGTVMRPAWRLGFPLLNAVVGATVLTVAYIAILALLRALPPEVGSVLGRRSYIVSLDSQSDEPR